MKTIVDKVLLFLFGAVLCYIATNSIYVVFYILMAISFSSLLTFQKRKYIRLVLFAGYGVACFAEFAFLAFLPLLLYDAPDTLWNGVLLLPLFVSYQHFSLEQLLILLCLLAVCWI